MGTTAPKADRYKHKMQLLGPPDKEIMKRPIPQVKQIIREVGNRYFTQPKYYIDEQRGEVILIADGTVLKEKILNKDIAYSHSRTTEKSNYTMHDYGLGTKTTWRKTITTNLALARSLYRIDQTHTGYNRKTDRAKAVFIRAEWFFIFPIPTIVKRHLYYYLRHLLKSEALISKTRMLACLYYAWNEITPLDILEFSKRFKGLYASRHSLMRQIYNVTNYLKNDIDEYRVVNTKVMHTRHCKGCGKDFGTPRYTATICTPECRLKHYAKINFEYMNEGIDASTNPSSRAIILQRINRRRLSRARDPARHNSYTKKWRLKQKTKKAVTP